MLFRSTNNAAPAYPTLFRPMFAFQTNGWPSNDFIRIAGYTTNQTDANGANAQNLLTLPMYDLSDPLSRMAMYQDPNAVVGATGDGVNQLCLVAGTPVIVGAKKGYPNFNEYAMQTVFSLSRKLEYAKTNATNNGPLALVSPQPVTTNQSLIISLFNINGFEAWNSYAAAFPRALTLIATNTTKLTITNEFGPLFTTNYVSGTNVNIGAGAWSGFANNSSTSFRSFLFTNVPHL